MISAFRRFFAPHFFAPHLRLIYLFLWGLVISALHQSSLLFCLNGAALVLLVAFIYGNAEPYSHYIKRWLWLNGFTFLLWLTLSWRIGAEGMELNPEGMETALLITLRMNLLLFSLWLFLWKMNDAVLVQAIGKLPLPSKLIWLFVLTVRYIALLGELRQKMDLAMRARGYRAGLNRRTLYVTAQRVALLLVHALLKAETAQIALKCRGFRFGNQQTLSGEK
ncbi:energy-coupling factor transporter transmembrane protein EcfT [Aggregatibacter actinomycetemcomitans]|uniref:energy-coupling factor transporter transmembrane component T family protein n=1 Tax=Aggregatibacter actinomycetemcomitans TaxID=714 RepID=UPI0011D4687C|nr:energy-coupling factor transporter transmembrane component T [Aggregatibacter actinomycetemcomitans]QEH45808.1 energy-coupling factor transporter transmembrane protein EcfT [Aggregatibacter actinomycetemcomitans]QEH49264.1 energy-coupling factor transporter transmembrane protein EcfT [Aggregatibacter actinomycetemcomitans]TYA50522.1 energy-coupling factor transporter transmembrane protein EcfT [Aggregatibacter actinomycetemcomitans]TYB28427.1 energy-coupling factor transporter transmembrane 